MDPEDKAYYDKRHEMIALPCVRVISDSAGGSGTVIWSGANEEGGFSTYVLTNHHVVADAIKIEQRWSALLRREVKQDVFNLVDIHFFTYRWESRAIGGWSVQSDIMAYDKDEDLALIRLRTDQQAPAVAQLYPRGGENDLRVGMKVICVGAGLLEPPVQTEGLLSQFGIDINRKEFWLNTAASIFGNSGGALFLKNSYELIAVPSRIAVAFLGFSVDAITHLSYAIPITRIYDFLDTQRFRFIYDTEYTETGEEDERIRIRKNEERKLAVIGDD